MTWWQYLMLVNVYLLLFYGFYALLLSRETFFQLNRIYLVSAALLSFFIPLIQSDWVKNLFITQKVQYTLYANPVLQYRFQPLQDTHFTLGQLLVIIYLAGIVFLLGRFAWQLIALKKIISNTQSGEAYSFFKKIKLDDDHENHAIVAAHENVHASQWHSADVLIMEALLIINWFNPVVYLYRFAIKHIHEYIADRQALKSGTDKADYALILLSQTFNAPAHQLVNPFFNKSLLKQRILMLQKNKSHRVALFKYFLSAPLFILMLILSSASVNNSKTIRLINDKVSVILLKPADGESNAKTVTPFAKTVTPFKEVTISAKKDKAAAKVTNPKEVAEVTIDDTTRKKDGPVFTSVEKVPQFPGGIDAFAKFLATHIRYPAEARKNNVQGRVIISFVVETDGQLSNIHIARGIGSGADEEAIRVIGLSPKWQPGTQNGRLVRVAYSVPIMFSLDDSGHSKASGNKADIENENQGGREVTLGSMNVIVSKTDTGTQVFQFKTTDPSKAPIYVLDGKRVSSLTSVNPADIDNITVLRDKNATALYGPNADNGVVVVVTKKYKLKLSPATPVKN